MPNDLVIVSPKTPSSSTCGSEIPYALQVVSSGPYADCEANGIRVAVWGTGFFNCFQNLVPNCCMAAFCPCVSLARITSRLSLYRYKNVLYGLLAVAIVQVLILITAFAQVHGSDGSAMTLSEKDPRYKPWWTHSGVKSAHASTNSDDDSYGLDHSRSFGDDINDLATSPWGVFSIFLSFVYILTAWRLRMKIRERFQIPGSWLGDLLLSCFFPVCNIAQMSTRVKSYKPGRCDFGPADVLPAYLPMHDSNFGTCQKDSACVFFPFTGFPTESPIEDLCTSKACQSLLTEIVDADLQRCDVQHAGKTYNIKAIVYQHAGQCLPSNHLCVRWERVCGCVEPEFMGDVSLVVCFRLRDHAPAAREREHTVEDSVAWDAEVLARPRAQVRDADEKQHSEHECEVPIQEQAAVAAVTPVGDSCVTFTDAGCVGEAQPDGDQNAEDESRKVQHAGLERPPKHTVDLCGREARTAREHRKVAGLSAVEASDERSPPFTWGHLGLCGLVRLGAQAAVLRHALQRLGVQLLDIERITVVVAAAGVFVDLDQERRVARGRQRRQRRLHGVVVGGAALVRVQCHDGLVRAMQRGTR
ncbi:Plac8 family protein, partial [Globisporangium splendens]